MLPVCALAANDLEDLGRLRGLLDRELSELYFQPPAGLRIVGGRGTAGSRWSGLEE